MCLLRKYHTSTFSHRTSLTRICSYENEDGEGVRAVVGVGSKGGDQLRICLGGCWGKRGNGTRREWGPEGVGRLQKRIPNKIEHRIPSTFWTSKIVGRSWTNEAPEKSRKHSEHFLQWPSQIHSNKPKFSILYMVLEALKTNPEHFSEHRIPNTSRIGKIVGWSSPYGSPKQIRANSNNFRL